VGCDQALWTDAGVIEVDCPAYPIRGDMRATQGSGLRERGVLEPKAEGAGYDHARSTEAGVIDWRGENNPVCDPDNSGLGLREVRGNREKMRS